MKTWVKLYVEVLDDPDQGTLTLAQRGIWSLFLALAGKVDERDGEDRETGRLDTLPRVAWMLRCELDEVAGAVEAFIERGMVDVREGEVLYLTNYGARQAAMSDAERQRRHRERERRAQYYDTGRNGSRPASVTPCDEVCNESVTVRDTDTESDTESDIEVEEMQSQTQSSAGNGGGSVQQTAAGLFSEANCMAVSPLDTEQIEALVREADEFIAGLPREGPGGNVSGEEWVCEAIREANRSKQNNRVPVKFVQAILDRWEREGYRSPMKRGRQGRSPPAEYEAGDYAAGVCAKCGASPCMCERDAGGNGQDEGARAREAWREAEKLLSQQAIFAPFKQCTVLGLSADGGLIRVSPEESQRAWFERRPAIAQKARACGVEVVLDGGG